MPTNIIVPRELWPRRSDWTGIVIEVYKEEGDPVALGETLVDVEIEKAVIAIDSPINGVVDKVYVSKGDKIGPNTILLSIREE
ncbi:MAG: lipoyl domain-containing protein [Desulfurococcales archaeon]|nr:lipoyl domain-containing protein [Desulfurococcales archaeon]